MGRFQSKAHPLESVSCLCRISVAIIQRKRDKHDALYACQQIVDFGLDMIEIGPSVNGGAANQKQVLHRIFRIEHDGCYLYHINVIYITQLNYAEHTCLRRCNEESHWIDSGCRSVNCWAANSRITEQEHRKT